jgi:hypothetical protein
VFLHGHDEPVHVELTPEQRGHVNLTDEEIHDVIPDAVASHVNANHDDPLSSYGTWDQPLRIDHVHLLV